MYFAKFKQVLVYVGLSFSFLFASVGVSNASTPDTFSFTVTAEVCDPMDPSQHTPGSLTGVSVGAGSSLNLGMVTAGTMEIISFAITASNPQNCLDEDLGSEDIIIGYSDAAFFSDIGCDTSDLVCSVDVTIPMGVTTFTETITFSHTP
jgi:hypothetical protein